MRTILLATVAAATLVSGAAVAADLPRRTVAPVAPAPVVAIPVFTWSGFYIGANAGYGFNANDDDDDFNGFVAGDFDGDGDADAVDTVLLDRFGFRTGPFGSGEDDDEGGFVGGGQIGFNVQAGSIVYGIEADIQYVDLNQRNTNFAFALDNDGFFDDDGDEAFFGTVRGRLGFAFDRALLYVTGGLAYGDVGNVAFMNQFGVRTTTDDDINIGYTIGGGLEYAITNNITVKIEGLYVNLENDEQDNFRPRFNAATNNVVFVADGRRAPETEFAVVRAGVNFKFNTFGF